DPRSRDQSKYCRFHWDHGHHTDDCRELKNEIEALIQRGYLYRFIARELGHRPGKQPMLVEPTSSPKWGQLPPTNPCTKGVIRMIAGGPGAGGDSKGKRKDYAREVDKPGQPSKLPRLKEPITFSDEDLEGIRHPHDDPLVVNASIDGFYVHRLLVDNGSGRDILYFDYFTKMGLSVGQLRRINYPLYGFTGDSLNAEGSITLPATFGTPPRQATVTVEFVIVRTPSAYNGIIGRGIIN